MTLSVFQAVATPVAAFVVAWWLVGRIRDLALKRSLLDQPNERSSHTVPTPRLGGLAVTALCLAALATGALLDPGTRTYVVALAVSGLVVAAVSLADDISSLSAAVRFPVHFGAAAAALWFHPARATLDIPLLEGLLPGAFVLALLFVWIVGLLNAFNFMDGIDGIAGGQAAVAALVWTVVAILVDAPVTAVVGLVVLGSSLGFLAHNWHPARIFLGDVGSAFLGYLLAVLPLLAIAEAPQAAPGVLLGAGALAVWPFVVDAATTFARRLVRRENVFAPHRTHVYQRLARSAGRHDGVSALYTTLAAAGGVFAVAWVAGWAWAPWSALALLLVASATVYLRCVRAERVGAAT